MKATKTKFSVTVEVLDADSIPGLLFEVSDSFDCENEQGMIRKRDGDEVFWSIEQTKVEF